MKLRSPTIVEALTVLAIVAILIGLLQPTPHEQRERELREIASRWNPQNAIVIADAGVLALDLDLRGTWSRGTRRGGSEIEISPTANEGEYGIVFHTGSSFGGCTWETTAKRQGARLTLAEPVADIWNDAYKTFWIVNADEIDALVPAPKVQDFNVAVANQQNAWRYDTFTRGPR